MRVGSTTTTTTTNLTAHICIEFPSRATNDKCDEYYAEGTADDDGVRDGESHMAGVDKSVYLTVNQSASLAYVDSEAYTKINSFINPVKPTQKYSN